MGPENADEVDSGLTDDRRKLQFSAIAAAGD